MNAPGAWIVLAALGLAPSAGAAEPAKTLRLLDETAAQWATAQPATIFVARSILTADPDRPAATAVAVAEGQVLSVGTLETVAASLGGMPFDVDRRFAGKVIVPGFIETNADAVFAAIAFGTEIISAEDWKLAGRTTRVARNREEYLARVTQAAAKIALPSGTLFTWGYEPGIHGDLGRTQLDKASPRRPVVLWSRAGDMLVFNSAALRKYGIVEPIPEEARFSGSLQGAALAFVAKDLFTPRRFATGLQALRKWLPGKGITTLAQSGALTAIAPQHLLAAALDDASTPFRSFLIADGSAIYAAAAKSGELEDVVARTQRYATLGRGRVQWLSRQVAIRCENGEEFEGAFRMFWDAGYQIHAEAGAECDGEMILRLLREGMETERRRDHRLTVALPADAPPQLAAELISLGAIATTRRPGFPEGRLSRASGLASITSQPAFALRREGYVGSIKAGSNADFAILEADPARATGTLDAIRIWGTVVSGRVYPAK